MKSNFTMSYNENVPESDGIRCRNKICCLISVASFETPPVGLRLIVVAHHSFYCFYYFLFFDSGNH